MGYRETLAADWTTRDRLAVILIALTVAFMTGTTLLVVSADAQMTTMTTQYGSNASIDYYDNPAVATGNASGDAVVFPLATATVDGTSVTVVGVPADVTDGLPTMQLVPPPERGVAIPNRTGQRQFHGTDDTLNLTVHDAGNDVFPRTWYRASPETVDRLGATGALVVTPSDETVSETGAPTRAVLSFFRTGFRQIQGAVTLVVAGAAVLVAITVFSVTTASVVARRRTIGVLRTTGGTLRTVLAVFGLRALLLTTAGVLVGYALGVIGTNLVVNVSVYLGVPTSLSMHVTDRVLALLVPAYLAIVGLGAFCGVLAAWRAVDRTPSALLRSPAASKGRWLSVLDWRALAPTTAALMVFVVCALLLWSAGAAASPVVDSEGTTVVQQNAPNPLVSTVPVEYATVLQSADVAASPEIVAFSVLDGRPFLTRGADYPDYSAVADTRIVDGRPPNASDEAVVGTALASTLDLEPGDTIALGGSTYTAVSRVTVVGTFSGPGAVDDQLVVSLPVARTLTGLPDGTVQFVRTDRVPEGSDRGVTTLGIEAPSRWVGNGTVPVTVTLLNVAGERDETTATAHADGDEIQRTVTVPPGKRTAVTLQVPLEGTGNHTITVAGLRRTVTVVAPTALEVRGLPEVVPSNSSTTVRVETASGDSVANATLRVGDRTVTTDADGRATVPFGQPGTVAVRVMAGGRSIERTVDVSEDADQRLSVDLSTGPANPTVIDKVHARVVLRNHRSDSISKTVVLSGSGASTDRNVTVPPGDRRSLSLALGRLQPGTHEVVVRIDGEQRATSTIQISGDKRLASALATRGASGSTGLGRAIETAFGNLKLFLVALIVLAGGACSGSVATTFSQAVRRRRYTLGIHRATGASAGQVARTVLGDALVVGTAGTVVALTLGVAVVFVLAEIGMTTFFGVRVTPVLSPVFFVGLAAGSLVLVLAGATIATLGLLEESPHDLLTQRTRFPSAEDSRGPLTEDTE